MSTYGLDSKDILKLDKGVSSNVVTVIPDSVATDVVALGPALATSISAGVIPFREAGAGGQLKAVTVSPSGAWAGGTLTIPAARTLPELFEGWQHHSNPGRVEAIELENTGMKTGLATTPFTFESSSAADFGASQFGTVAVRNTLGPFVAGTTYLVQVKTDAMGDTKTPVLITQVAPALARFGRWPNLCNMPCGVIPSRTTGFFNIWFTPGGATVIGSEIWFNWFIPFKTAPDIILAIRPVESALP